MVRSWQMDRGKSTKAAEQLRAGKLKERLWLGRQDSNLGWRNQNPLPYRLATPQQDRQSGAHHKHIRPVRQSRRIKIRTAGKPSRQKKRHSQSLSANGNVLSTSELDLFQIILCSESLRPNLVAFLQQERERAVIPRSRQIRQLACNNTLIYIWVGAWIGLPFPRHCQWGETPVARNASGCRYGKQVRANIGVGNENP